MATRVTGLRQTVRALERFGVSTDDLKAAFGRITAVVQATALRRVKRVSGDLAATVRPAKTKNKAVIRAGGARAPYAGRYNYTVDPFLSESADDFQPEAIRLIEEDLKHLAKQLNL